MGLSIHYSGKLKNADLITELTAEVIDLCKELEWEYHLIAGPNKDGLTGIIFSPVSCEPICLTILTDGKLCSPFNLQNKELYKENGLDPELIYTTSTKTQYAGMETHIAIIKLLKHLKEKYFSVFELSDEGRYWETMDEKILLGQFTIYETAINGIAEALAEMEVIKNEPVESLMERIERVLKEKLSDNN